MCLSFQVEYFPSHEDVLKLTVLTEKHFVQEKKLRELGWCANYMMDKREHHDFMTDFILINCIKHFCLRKIIYYKYYMW